MSAVPAAPAEAPASKPSLREQIRAGLEEAGVDLAPQPAAPDAQPEPTPAPSPEPAAETPPAPAPDPRLDALQRELAETKRVLDSVRGNVGQLSQERQRLAAELAEARRAPYAERAAQEDKAIADAEAWLKTVTDPAQWQQGRAQIDAYRERVGAERRQRELAEKEQQIAQREQLLTFAQAQQLRGAVPQLVEGYAAELAKQYGLAADALLPYIRAEKTQRGMQVAMQAINRFEDIGPYLTPTTDLLETIAATLAQAGAREAQADAAANRAGAAEAHRPEGGGASGAQPPREIKTTADIKRELKRRLAAGELG
jgi:hypothetical protein